MDAEPDGDEAGGAGAAVVDAGGGAAVVDRALVRLGGGLAGALVRRTGGGAAEVARPGVGRRACVVASADRALLEAGTGVDAGPLVMLVDRVPCPLATCPVGNVQAAIPTIPHPMTATADATATR